MHTDISGTIIAAQDRNRIPVRPPEGAVHILLAAVHVRGNGHRNAGLQALRILRIRTFRCVDVSVMGNPDGLGRAQRRGGAVTQRVHPCFPCRQRRKLCQEIRPEIPDDYAEVIAKAMSVDKSKRYQTMDELMDALNEIQL